MFGFRSNKIDNPKLFNDEDVESVVSWFNSFGETDLSYLRAHFKRFKNTKSFALAPSQGAKLSILDVGAHLLHNAALYHNDGHKVFCVDGGGILRNKAAIKISEAIGLPLFDSRCLEQGDGLDQIPTGTIDLVLFCEIIEHIAYNPIVMWKEIYRVLKPGGRIIVTTPNANHWPRLLANILRLTGGGGWGAKVDDIMATGTFGHHWKEFTAAEIREYFTLLSSDFVISRLEFVSLIDEREPPSDLPFSLGDVRGDTIFAEISLPRKKAGISISPPWVLNYT